jgi:hypothetical protein
LDDDDLEIPRQGDFAIPKTCSFAWVPVSSLEPFSFELLDSERCAGYKQAKAFHDRHEYLKRMDALQVVSDDDDGDDDGDDGDDSLGMSQYLRAFMVGSY